MKFSTASLSWRASGMAFAEMSEMDAAALHQVAYGTQIIAYRLDLGERKTLAVSVQPDLSVVVKAPAGTPLEQVKQKVAARASWILKQQREFSRYLPNVPPRRYVSGENHRYLGRQYRLKVIGIAAAETEHVELTRQFLAAYVHDKSPEYVRPLVEAWFHEQAQEVFAARLQACYPKAARFGLPFPRIVVRKMKASWGSCSARGLITLNLKLIQVPVEYIDYVILHELCHLQERNHGAEFEKLLMRVLPDWRERKQRLDGYDFG